MLPVVEIHDISAGVMERVLDFVYTDSFPAGLGAEWMTPAGAEQLFNAADMLLLFSMKVCGIASLQRLIPRHHEGIEICAHQSQSRLLRSRPQLSNNW